MKKGNHHQEHGLLSISTNMVPWLTFGPAGESHHTQGMQAGHATTAAPSTDHSKAVHSLLELLHEKTPDESSLAGGQLGGNLKMSWRPTELCSGLQVLITRVPVYSL